MGLAERVALVSGAGRGRGRGIAACLARATRGVQDIHELDATSPFGFVCQQEDIGDAVAFLCSEAGRYITHQVLYVDGGGFISPPAHAGSK